MSTKNELTSFVMQSIKEVDFIGREPKMNIQGSSRMKTVFGGVLCILIYIVVTLCGIYFGKELILKEQPIIITTTQLLRDNDVINIDKGKLFNVSIALRDKEGGIMVDIKKYLTITLKDVVTVDNKIINATDVMFVKQGEWLSVNSSNVNGSETYMKQDDKVKRYLELKYEINNAYDNNNTLTDVNEVNDILSHASLVLKYVVYDIDILNYKTPGYSIINEEYISLNKYIDTHTIMSFQLNEVNTDIGSVFPIIKQNMFLNLKSITKDYILNNNNNNNNSNSNSYYKGSITFLIDKSKHIHHRKYYKIQNWLAELAGVVYTLTLTASILNYFNDKSTFYENLVNGLFDLDDIIKYFQYRVPKNQSKHRKRDSVFLHSAKKEKDYFEKGFNQKMNNSDRLMLNSMSLLGRFTLDNNYLKQQQSHMPMMAIPQRFSHLSVKDILPSYKKSKSLCKTAAGDNNTNKEEAKNVVDGNGSHLNLLAGINRFISHNNTLKDPHNLNSNTKEEKPVTIIANQPNEQNEQQQSSVSSRNNGTKEENNHKENYIDNLRANVFVKEHFEKVKKKRFKLGCYETMVFTFCTKKFNPKYNAFYGGRNLIIERSDILYLLRKNLELERFKYLFLMIIN